MHLSPRAAERIGAGELHRLRRPPQRRRLSVVLRRQSGMRGGRGLGRIRRRRMDRLHLFAAAVPAALPAAVSPAVPSAAACPPAASAAPRHAGRWQGFRRVCGYVFVEGGGHKQGAPASLPDAPRGGNGINCALTRGACSIIFSCSSTSTAHTDGSRISSSCSYATERGQLLKLAPRGGSGSQALHRIFQSYTCSSCGRDLPARLPTVSLNRKPNKSSLSTARRDSTEIRPRFDRDPDPASQHAII
mmetsp:Transcript_4801/g.15766  ORF Transcript_4801/g.15766 Transcript_4801/m.15766 type:complete len:246 (+) Transcript_4801:447-1184(+)